MLNGKATTILLTVGLTKKTNEKKIIINKQIHKKSISE